LRLQEKLEEDRRKEDLDRMKRELEQKKHDE